MPFHLVIKGGTIRPAACSRAGRQKTKLKLRKRADDSGTPWQLMSSDLQLVSGHRYINIVPSPARAAEKGLHNRRTEDYRGRGRCMSKLIITILFIVGEIAVVGAGFVLYLVYS
jgi:hypothetical protein